jgi:hypothetical protein
VRQRKALGKPRNPAVIALWTWTFASGSGWERGLFVYQNGNIPIFHVLAELGMACTVLLGLQGWRRGLRWGLAVTTLGAGMFGYSAINSLGWALHNDVVLAIPMLASWIGIGLLLSVASAQRDAA